MNLRMTAIHESFHKEAIFLPRNLGDGYHLTGKHARGLLTQDMFSGT